MQLAPNEAESNYARPAKKTLARPSFHENLREIEIARIVWLRPQT